MGDFEHLVKRNESVTQVIGLYVFAYRLLYINAVGFGKWCKIECAYRMKYGMIMEQTVHFKFKKLIGLIFQT